jgi:hypothetical protein
MKDEGGRISDQRSMHEEQGLYSLSSPFHFHPSTFILRLHPSAFIPHPSSFTPQLNLTKNNTNVLPLFGPFLRICHGIITSLWSK